MRLEGTLDAFSLPDIFQLLSYTKKTGTLHLRRQGVHGAVHLREGQVTGARSDVVRQALGRRLVGAGLVDDEALASAVELLVDDPTAGLGRTLVEGGHLDAATARTVAAEQATDAVFDLMRWTEGAFTFVVDEPDPDDLGAALPVETVVEEGQRRLATWPALTAAVPARDAVVCLAPTPAEPPVLSRDEWQLLSVVDGRRSVGDLVTLTGRGDYATVGALAGLVERGLLQVRDAGPDGTSALLRRQQLLAALEGQPLPQEPVDGAAATPLGGRSSGPVPAAAAPLVPAPAGVPPAVAVPVQVVPAPAAPVPARAAVVPERPEPFTPARTPDHPEQVPAHLRGGPVVGAVHGSAALAPEGLELAPGALERDPSINKSLLLRLIAGVRGL